MKVIVQRRKKYVKSISLVCTPTEALLVNHAMRRYTEDEGVNERNREEMDKMLFTEPTFEDAELEPSKDGVKTELENVLDKVYEDIQRLRGCTCMTSDGIIDDVEDIIDKYREGTEND